MVQTARCIALLTGGSSGLGRECALALLQRDMDVCTVARHAHRLRSPTADGGSGGGRLLSRVCDVSSAEALTALRHHLTEAGLSVKWLLNVAGVGIFGPLTSQAPESIREVLDSNLLGTILATREFLDDIVSNRGAICNVMSTAALVGRPHELAYVAAKWGARGFTEALRAELRGQPVRIMAVYPGGMRTPFWDRSPGHADPARFMQPSEVARLIVSNLLDPSPCQVSDLRIDRLDHG